MCTNVVYVSSLCDLSLCYFIGLDVTCVMLWSSQMAHTVVLRVTSVHCVRMSFKYDFDAQLAKPVHVLMEDGVLPIRTYKHN